MSVVVNLYQPYSFFESGKTWIAAPVTPGNHATLEYQNGQQKIVLSGSFLTYQSGDIAGTVDTITLYSGGAKVYDIYGIEGEVRTFLDSLVKGSFETTVLPRVLSGNDYIYGSEGDDGLLGYDGNDVFHAGPGNDRIDAGAGDDIIVVGTGSDSVDGGAGFDRVVEDGNLADFTLVRTGSGFTLTNLRDGTIDTLVNVERVQFADKQVALDVAVDNHGGQAFRLYRAAFDRTPDEPGLHYWTVQLDKGLSGPKLAESFVASNEFKTLYGAAPGNHDLVARFYEHVLHRAPDSNGLDFWTGVLDQHRASVAEVLSAISESPENVAATTPLIANGVVLDYPIIY